MTRLTKAGVRGGLIVASLALAPLPALAGGTDTSQPAACITPDGKPQLLCDGETCIRVSVAELCRSYRAAIAQDPAVLHVSAQEDARRAMTRLVASIR